MSFKTSCSLVVNSAISGGVLTVVLVVVFAFPKIMKLDGRIQRFRYAQNVGVSKKLLEISNDVFVCF